MPKNFEELTFTDDWMFQKVMQNPKICAELVERLLHINVDHVEYPANLKPALGKRTRYYQSMIDIDSLMKGEEYDKLKESYILFICKNDPFKDDEENQFGLPCYTFRNICAENDAVNLDDKAIKVIYNASAYVKEEDPLIRDFLHFIYTDEPGDDLSSRLSELIKQYKENETNRSDYLAVNLHDYDIRYEALQEGAQQKAVEAAKSFYTNGASIKLIAQSLHMTEDQVGEIVKDTVPAKSAPSS